MAIVSQDKFLTFGVGKLPAIAAGANVGTTPTLTLGTGSSDIAGSISVTVGGTPAAGALAVVTFDNPYGGAPLVLVTPTVSLAASTYKFFVTATATTFTINCTNTPTAADVVTLNYFVVGIK